MSIALIFCLAFGALGAYGSILVPGYEAGALYAGYNGEYANKYNNYEKSYAYEYGVSDPHTGDHKSQWETKDKEGTVRGSYSLLEPDGSTRIVDYVADEHGFRAVVKKVGVHGVSVESHGNADGHAEVAVATPATHIESHPTTIIEEPVAYKSYDGGYEDYSDLKPVVGDVYTKPLEYVQAPKAELIINVPDHNEKYPTSYAHNELHYPKAEGLKVALPQQYWSPEYVAQEKYVLPKQKYVLPQEKYVLPHQQEYVLPQEKYVLPQQEYVLPQQEYVLPQEKYALSEEKYVIPQEYVLPASKQIHEYLIPQQHHAVSEYQSAPIAYQVPQKAAHSYVQERRYNTPKGNAVLVESPKFAYAEAPKQVYVAAPHSDGHYTLNTDYHY